MLEPIAVHLTDRAPDVVDAGVDLLLDPRERIEIVHSCANIYMTFLGKAVFSRELAERRLGLDRARTLAYYETDNPVLRELAAEFPHVELIRV